MLLFSRMISEDDLIDLQGKVAVVTGGNTGVGYATVQFLVRKGAKVYIAARNESKALVAIEQLKSENIGNGSLHWLFLDLSNPRIAKRAAEDFLTKEDRVDILVNNAAIIGQGPFTLDKDGLLDVMVTNHISHYAFTRTLIPLLKQTAGLSGFDVRVVNVTSMAHAFVHPTSFKGKEDINNQYGSSYSFANTYGHSKLANILHIKELQKSFDASDLPPDSKITCLSVHPGLINTIGTSSSIASMPYFGFIFKFLAGLFFSSWRTGGMNVAWAAAGAEIAASREKYAGKYVVPVARIAAPSAEAQDERLAKELIQTTEDILKELGM